MELFLVPYINAPQIELSFNQWLSLLLLRLYCFPTNLVINVITYLNDSRILKHFQNRYECLVGAAKTKNSQAVFFGDWIISFYESLHTMPHLPGTGASA